MKNDWVLDGCLQFFDIFPIVKLYILHLMVETGLHIIFQRKPQLFITENVVENILIMEGDFLRFHFYHFKKLLLCIMLTPILQVEQEHASIKVT